MRAVEGSATKGACRGPHSFDPAAGDPARRGRVRDPPAVDLRPCRPGDLGAWIPVPRRRRRRPQPRPLVSLVAVLYTRARTPAPRPGPIPGLSARSWGRDKATDSAYDAGTPATPSWR